MSRPDTSTPTSHVPGGRLLLIILIAAALLVAASVTFFIHVHPVTRFSVSYSGMDYYDPADRFTGCRDWTWLQPDCYTSVDRTDYHISPQEQLASDLAFISSHHLGAFQRVWISLDQLMLWSPQGRYLGLDARGLANLDNALQWFAHYGIKVDLVLLTHSPGDHDVNDFRPEALNGLHPRLHAAYLQSMRAFVSHLAASPIDRQTVAVMDLENEAYYQLERYFLNPSLLGTFSSCRNANDQTNVQCVDDRIIHPWLTALYQTAKAAAPRFLYTVSDTGRLLRDYGVWESMYPVDVYDIHMYDDRPWDHAALYARGRSLQKPWFVGEAGCSVGHITCTYDGANATRVDGWWLAHLRQDGARAVLLENQVTVWTDIGGPNHQTLTPTGREVQVASLAGGSGRS